ncbi:MAG TPA: hypothetical protein VHV10_00330, partial [Ktedonobacteraceae bacterium]|nr:hypothetical protein [Ktedonobacteraceae bacterium]
HELQAWLEPLVEHPGESSRLTSPIERTDPLQFIEKWLIASEARGNGNVALQLNSLETERLSHERWITPDQFQSCNNLSRDQSHLIYANVNLSKSFTNSPNE